MPAFADLRDETAITEGLIAVGMAREIAELCPAIEARRWRGLRYLYALRSAAAELGYSEAEIEAYVDDDAERDRLEGIARDRLEAHGAKPGDVAGHCAVGRAAIAEDGQMGRLLAPG
jgi:hypothetical protein